MSEQPPYGPPEPGTPPPPQQGSYPNYGYQGYPGYPVAPPTRSNSSRNVVIIVVVVVALLCAGVVIAPIVFFVWIVNEVEDGFNPDYRGSQNDPVTVEVGEAFEIRDFNYASGWKLNPGAATPLTGLSVSSNHENAVSSLRITFEFTRDDALLGTVDCSAPGGLRKGRKALMNCNASSAPIVGFDDIEVFDHSYTE